MLHGGFGPATAGRPRPYGMPPFTLTLNDTEIAAVITYTKNAWSNRTEQIVQPADIVAARK